jgi:predicted enzyme related to lactoylglutathione lyase
MAREGRPPDRERVIASDEFLVRCRSNKQDMSAGSSHPVVHLELHTGDLPRARAFYAELCGWQPEQIDTRHGSYVALALGGELGGGMVECATPHSLWLPYVEVAEIGEATERARRSGAAVLLEPREGPAGWRSVVMTPAAGEIALWQQKR